MKKNKNNQSSIQAMWAQPPWRLIFWLMLVLGLILLGWLFNDYRGGFYLIPLAEAVNQGMDWILQNLTPLFDGIKRITFFILNSLKSFLLWSPWWMILALIGLISWRLAGVRIAVFAMAGMYFILSLGLWTLSMETLAIVITAVTISLVLGIPTGILAARSNWVYSIIKPLLDTMQTMPSFVYLIPVLMFFGIGVVPGVIATVIFALPPAVRLTNLGIRQVPPDLVEAAQSFGSTSWQLLLKVQLPLALPSIMTGVNQTIMLSLSMTVLAAMIAAGGLGREIIMALGQVDLGRGFVAGMAIVLMAMILDRITQKLAKKEDNQLRH